MPDQKIANKDLRCVARVFKKLELPLFLCYGTALGAYRDNDFLPEEKFDIDLGTFGKENRFAVWKILKEKGFTSRARKVEIEKYGYLPIKRNVMIDLFFFEEDGNSYAMGETKCANLPKQFSTLKEITFLGHKYLAPSPIEEYLIDCYGDWKNPDNKKHGFP
jgi:phosphorylcholine metabolism protein LicD